MFDNFQFCSFSEVAEERPGKGRYITSVKVSLGQNVSDRFCYKMPTVSDKQIPYGSCTKTEEPSLNHKIKNLKHFLPSHLDRNFHWV